MSNINADGTLRVANYTRQELILPSEIAQAATVNVLGVGTVGSNAAVACACLGIGNINIIDPDVVEDHNLPSQRYVLDDLGRPKVDACVDRLKEVSHHANVEAVHGPFQAGDAIAPGIVILAIDDMDIRKAVFEQSVRYFGDLTLLIDARMGGNQLEMYALDPNNYDQVESYLNFGHSYTQEEAEPVPCGGRTVSYVGDISGGLIANYVRLHLTDKKVPFMTQFDLDTMQMTCFG